MDLANPEDRRRYGLILPERVRRNGFRTSQNTRYTQAFTNLSQGSSVFTIPPNNGVQDIVLAFELPADGDAGTDYRGAGVNRGWAYSLIKQVSFRYGGSSQYFLTGAQILQNALRQMPNTGARDQLLALGGNASAGAVAGAGDFATAQRGYVWLSLPHCVPTAEGKLPPIPSDLLTQQIQVTCELYPVSSIFSSVTPVPGAQVLPTSLSSATFTVQQVILENQGDALARRVDMTSHALSYPINFVQQEVQIPLANSVSQTVTLTGFRSGECKAIECWITKGADTSGAVKNPFKWYAPEDMIMTLNARVCAA